MNAEQFHDALSLLPSDLIAETDRLRSAPGSKVLPWKRWVSLAACLVLVLGCGWAVMRSGLLGFSGGSMEKATFDNAAAECAPQEPAAMYTDQKPTEAPAADSANGIVSDSREQSAAEPEEALTPTGCPTDGSAFLDLDAEDVFLTNLKPDISVCAAGNQAALFCSYEKMNRYWESAEALYQLGSLTEAVKNYDKTWFESYDLLVIRVGTEKSELVPTMNAFTLTGPDSCEIVIYFALMPEDNSPDPACWHILLPVQKGLLSEAIDITLLFP